MAETLQQPQSGNLITTVQQPEHINVNGIVELDTIDEENDWEDMIDGDMAERLSLLEKRVSQQDDEIVCLKTALADVVRRMSAFEGRRTATKHEGFVKIYLRGRSITMYGPSDLKDYSVVKGGLAPPEKLKLDWVYGYRGRDCRNNLHLLPTGEIVYFIAAVVVLYNIEEEMQRFYLGHTDDVKCIAVHPDKVTIATGQVAGHERKTDAKPPHVRIWDSVSLTTLRIIGINDFDRAVCCVSFSKSDGGSHILAVDDANDHVLSVWEWNKGEKGSKLSETKSSNDTVLGAEFHPMDSKQMVTCGKSHIAFWTLEDGRLSKKSGVFEKYEKPKFVLCIAFADNGDIISGDSNGNIFVWGRGNNRIYYAVPGAHEGPVFGLCVMKDGTLLSGGGKDRKILAWDRRYIQTNVEKELPELTGPIRTISQGKDDQILVGTTKNAILQGSVSGDFYTIMQTHTDELWGLAIHPSSKQFLTCAYDKHVILWDSSSHSQIWTKVLDDGCQSAAFHPSGTVITIGTLTGRWVAIDAASRDLVTVHYAVSENGYKYNKVGRCTGHSSFITHLDWSTDSQYIQSNSGDYEILFWNSSTCRQVTSPSSMRDVDWATFYCTLGFPVCGIWQEGADGTDVNTVCRSQERNVCATGDDFGKVNLFKYPCSQPKSHCHSYSGHSSHVTCVRFLKDDSRLLSTGGKDMSIMQWKLCN
uniref:Echinoderm microtubule-associated protein-like 1-like n=1 Tax=Saccoglossus kowalevskii TaxID=10224 RepID=A0ABM0LWR6_SACKO|nr:PREDICTED: echinoderm microtubule-associated protein-like 1-like [Saccoglossus kowalevskii]